MKNFICLVIFFVGVVNHSFSQSKKKQIEALSHRLDSVMRVVQNERETNSQKVSTLEFKIGQLNGEISNMQETIRQNEIIIDEKDKTIQESQNRINALKDSMSTLQMELTKLKPAPIEEVKESFPLESLPLVKQSGNNKTVTIGSQVWMKENLNVSNFRNGDPIPEAKTEEEWEKAGENGEPAWCYYDNDPANGMKYGKLYNWYAVNDPRGLAPVGYHIPADAEWDTLVDYFKRNPIYDTKVSYVEEGGYYEKKWVPCKTCSYWTQKQKSNNPCTACRNERGKIITGKYIPKTKKKIVKNKLANFWIDERGFSGLLGGRRNSNGGLYDLPTFYTIGTYGYWWSSTEGYVNKAWNRQQGSDISFISKDSHDKGVGLSVRCLMD